MANEFKIKNGLILGPLPSQPVVSIQDTSASIVADASSILVTGKAIYDYTRPFATNSSVGFALVPFATNVSVGTALSLRDTSIAWLNTNKIAGSGTINYLPKFTASRTLADSANYELSGILYGSVPLAPNLVQNSFMNWIESGIPVGFGSVQGNGLLVVSAVSPYTKGFEGVYTPVNSSDYATSPENATGTEPYWYGVYTKGERNTPGGLAGGWGGYTDGNILKIEGSGYNMSDIYAGNPSTNFPCYISFTKDSNVIGVKWIFTCWIKIIKGVQFAVGGDAGYYATEYPNTVPKTVTDLSSQGWYRYAAVMTTSHVSNINQGAVFSMAIQPDASGNVEAYIALPYMAVVTTTGTNQTSWQSSVLDKLARNNVYINPVTYNVGIGGVSSSTYKLDVAGNFHTTGALKIDGNLTANGGASSIWNLGIGGATAGYTFEVYGNSRTTGSVTIDGSVILNNQSISGLLTPVNASDAVNKYYVDNQGVNVNASLGLYVTNASIGLAGFATNVSIGTALGYFIRSTSAGTGLVWDGGMLDVSITTGVSSLASLSDVSIVDLSSNQFLQYDFETSKWKNVSPLEASLYFWDLLTPLFKEASIGTGFNWNAGMLDVSGGGDVTKIYVDGSLSTLNSSVNLAFKAYATNASVNIQIEQLNTSIGRIDASLNDVIGSYATNSSVGIVLTQFLKSSSIGTGFNWNAGMLDVSVAAGIGDASILASRVFYDPLTLDPSLAMPSAVGGILAGTTVANLSGDNVTTILNDLLFPTVQPILTAPTGTFAMSPTTTLYEVSTNIATLQFTTALNQGSIYNGITYQNVRSGSCNNYNYTGSNLTDVSSNTSPNIQSFAYDIQYGSQSWSAQIGYDQGPQPLNNKGGNATTGPLVAGTLTAASTRSIEGSYPYYATTVDVSTLTKQTLLALVTTPVPNTGNGFILVGETGDVPNVTKQKFEIPSARLTLHALSGIKTYSTVSGQWEYEGGSAASSLITWTTSASTNTIQGYVSNYNLYTYAGTKRDSTKIYLEF